jgi:hypothetical protein
MHEPSLTMARVLSSFGMIGAGGLQRYTYLDEYPGLDK